jgi:hypothetical protein
MQDSLTPEQKAEAQRIAQKIIAQLPADLDEALYLIGQLDALVAEKFRAGGAVAAEPPPHGDDR